MTIPVFQRLADQFNCVTDISRAVFFESPKVVCAILAADIRDINWTIGLHFHIPLKQINCLSVGKN